MTVAECDRQTAGETLEAIAALQYGVKLTHKQHGLLDDLCAALSAVERSAPCPTTPCSPPRKPEASAPPCPSSPPAAGAD